VPSSMSNVKGVGEPLDWYDPRAPGKPKEAPKAKAKPAVAPPPPLAPAKEPKLAEADTAASAWEVDDDLDLLEEQPQQASVTEKQKDAQPAPAARQLAPMEAARSVEEALKAKEKLAKHSVESAMQSMVEKRKRLEEEQKQQLLKLQEEEAQLHKLKSQVGSDQGKLPEVEDLRGRIERLGRDMHTATRDLDKKRETMRKATEAYVEAEETLTGMQKKKHDMEQGMLDMLMAVGKERDEKLNQILTSI